MVGAHRPPPLRSRAVRPNNYSQIGSAFLGNTQGREAERHDAREPIRPAARD